jgi:hypothetical protein
MSVLRREPPTADSLSSVQLQRLPHQQLDQGRGLVIRFATSRDRRCLDAAYTQEKETYIQLALSESHREIY